MSKLYPAMLQLAGRRCVVIGGGAVAARKVARLLQAEACVTVIAPRIGLELESLVTPGSLQVERRNYTPGDLVGAALAFAATDSRAVNAAVAVEATERGIPVNVADDSAASTFQSPATIERDGLTVALSTGGRSPAFARRLREELDRFLTPERLMLLELYAELRADLASSGDTLAGGAWAAVDQTALELLRDGRRAEARQRLRAQLLAGAGRGS